MPHLRGASEPDVAFVVENNTKNRFKLKVVDGETQIRANQGHSETAILQDDLVMRRVKDATEIPVCIHGTDQVSWESIRHGGLRRMGRRHVHFAAGLPGDSGCVVSGGARKGCHVFIYVDAKLAMRRHGIPFFVSDNGVILSPGPIPPACFSKVLSAEGASLMMTPTPSRDQHVNVGASGTFESTSRGDHDHGTSRGVKRQQSYLASWSNFLFTSC